jgi:hypothetical protein
MTFKITSSVRRDICAGYDGDNVADPRPMGGGELG